MIFLNLTDADWSDIEQILRQHLEGLSPVDWLVTPYKNTKFPSDHGYSDAQGLALRGKYPRSPASYAMKAIVWERLPELLALRNAIQDIIPNAVFSGSHFMTHEGYMSWHTNQFDSAAKPHRLYMTYNASTGSQFKYIIPGDDKVSVFEEPAGWYAKVFYIENEFPHCIRSGTDRWSFGMRF